MSSSNIAAVCDYARALHTALHRAAHLHGSLSRWSLAPIPSSEYDVESAIWTPRQGSRNGHPLETEEADITSTALDRQSPAMPTATASTSHIPDTPNLPRSQFNNLVNSSSMSNGTPVHGEGDGSTGSRPNEEPTTTTTVSWHSKTLSSFTIYGELSVARTPEEFAFVHSRLQQEWTLAGSFLVGIAAANLAILAIAPDSTFKIDSYTHTAVATSSAACSLGFSCDLWFLLRYNWVDLETFIYRSRDVYGSYASFSLSSRIPTLCIVISSISLMTFLGFVAYDASPVGVLVIGILVVLIMTIQFIVYGTHQCATSSLHVWRSYFYGQRFERLRGFSHRG